MRFWICMSCGLVHKKETEQCECGMLAMFAHVWVEFTSEHALKVWIILMNTRMGAKLKYAGD